MSIANELITRGWTQLTREDAEGRVCLAGAASYATVGNAYGQCVESKEFMDMWRTLSGLVGYPMGWNDVPGRTFDEVLRVAKEADEILDGLT